MKEKSLAEKKSSESVYAKLKETEEDQLNLTQKLQKQSKSFAKGIAYYSLPLISIAIFAALLIFGTIPAIKKILNYNREIESKQGEIDELDREIGSLEELKANQYEIESDLDIIDSIVPSEKTQVAKFVGEIEDLALQYGLEESKHESGETIERLEDKDDEDEETTDESAAIRNIPTTSEYVAEFGSIKNFLNALYNKNDFIIVNSLDMQGHEAREYYAKLQEDRGEQVTVDTDLSVVSWTMEVTFEKYQFSKGFNEYLSENSVSINVDPDEETLNFIRERYGED